MDLSRGLSPLPIISGTPRDVHERALDGKTHVLEIMRCLNLTRWLAADTVTIVAKTVIQAPSFAALKVYIFTALAPTSRPGPGSRCPIASSRLQHPLGNLLAPQHDQ